MFDPHHIGPRYETSYSRNKGRVLQRKVKDTKRTYTREELEKLLPVMIQNGLVNGTTPDPPPTPTPTPTPDPGPSIKDLTNIVYFRSIEDTQQGTPYYFTEMQYHAQGSVYYSPLQDSLVFTVQVSLTESGFWRIAVSVREGTANAVLEIDVREGSWFINWEDDYTASYHSVQFVTQGHTTFVEIPFTEAQYWYTIYIDANIYSLEGLPVNETNNTRPLINKLKSFFFTK